MTESEASGRRAMMAREGDCEGLLALAEFDAEGDGDRLAYKWLSVAIDFGHAEADEWIEDLLEVSSLRYDDDRFAVSSAHFELGIAYLSGGEGLQLDLEKGRRHLERAAKYHWPQQGDGMLAEARDSLTGQSLAVFGEVFVSDRDAA